jgi:hypothetical protein
VSPSVTPMTGPVKVSVDADPVRIFGADRADPVSLSSADPGSLSGAEAGSLSGAGPVSVRAAPVRICCADAVSVSSTRASARARRRRIARSPGLRPVVGSPTRATPSAGQ